MAKVAPIGEDENTIFHALPRYLPSFGAVMMAKEEAVTAVRESSGAWLLHLSLRTRNGIVQTSCPFNADGPPIVVGDELLRWGVVRLGPGVWALSESIHVEGAYHGYVVMRDVPEPAPWQSPNREIQE